MCDRIKINYRGWLLVTNFLAFLFHLCLPPATFKGGFCTGQFHYLEFESKIEKEEKKRYIDSSQGKRFSGGLWDGLAALTVWEKVDGHKEVLYPLHHVWQVQVETFVNSNSLLPNLHQIPHWENDTEDCFKNSLFYFSGDSAISDHRKCHMLVSVFLPRNSFSEFHLSSMSITYTEGIIDPKYIVLGDTFFSVMSHSRNFTQNTMPEKFFFKDPTRFPLLYIDKNIILASIKFGQFLVQFL